jgi:uncharacterized protein YqhQ
MIPVLGAQYLTTREPDASMMEVALAAFKAVRAADAPVAQLEEIIV